VTQRPPSASESPTKASACSGLPPPPRPREAASQASASRSVAPPCLGGSDEIHRDGSARQDRAFNQALLSIASTRTDGRTPNLVRTGKEASATGMLQARVRLRVTPFALELDFRTLTLKVKSCGMPNARPNEIQAHTRSCIGQQGRDGRPEARGQLVSCGVWRFSRREGKFGDPVDRRRVGSKQQAWGGELEVTFVLVACRQCHLSKPVQSR